MTTPNEELILKLRGQAYTTCRPDQLCDQAADLLQSQAERIKVIERESEMRRIALHDVMLESDQLRAQLAESISNHEACKSANTMLLDEIAAIAATEPLAYVNSAQSALINIAGNPAEGIEMTTPNEDLILKLRGQAYTTCRPDQLCDQAADLLQFQAERIATLEAENTNLKAYAKHERSLGAEPFVIENNDLRQERDTLRAQIAEIEATEPVAVRHSFDGYGWSFIDNGSGSTWLERGMTKEHAELLFTRPRPAQGITELVDALEMIVSTHQGHCEHYVGVSKHSHNLADIAEEALSKYKGAKQ